jgi:hypothetical protein
MPKILYPQVIQEDPRELERLEMHHRYTHLFQRVRMLRLLKSGEYSNLAEAADALGYSWRQCQRWFVSYRQGGLKSCSKAGWTNAVARSWLRPKLSRSLKRP